MKHLLAVGLFGRPPAPAQLDRLALVAVLIIALFVRFHSITVPTIWGDEAYSLLLARETPARIWALTSLDVHPPLYYMFLHYWGAVWGDAPLPARALSVLADVGTLLLCIKLMSLISTRRATWIAALLLALLPISIRFSQEARMYTLLGFWLMGATLALVCWARKPEQKHFAVIYALLMVAAFYTHYFAGLCVLVHWLFWWQSRSSRTVVTIGPGEWLITNITVVLLYLPWIPHLLNQLADTGLLDWIVPVTLQQALMIVWQFSVIATDSLQSPMLRLLPLVLMLLFAATIIANSSDEQRFNWLPVSYFFVPLIALYLIALVHALFVPRYLFFSAPALAMMTAVALDIWGKHRIWLASAVLFFVVVVQLHGITMVYRQNDELNGTNVRKDTGFASLVMQLNQNALPGDQVIIADAYWFPVFSYYSSAGVDLRFEVRSSLDDFLKLPRRGVLSLISDPVRLIYIDGVTVLDCRNPRIWWVTDAGLHGQRPLFAKGRSPRLTLHGGRISAYLFIAEPVPNAIASGTCSTLGPRLQPLPAAQNCPPAPSATSASKTRHSLPR